jgi:hypothetical protein
MIGKISQGRNARGQAHHVPLGAEIFNRTGANEWEDRFLVSGRGFRVGKVGGKYFRVQVFAEEWIGNFDFYGAKKSL